MPEHGCGNPVLPRTLWYVARAMSSATRRGAMRLPLPPRCSCFWTMPVDENKLRGAASEPVATGPGHAMVTPMPLHAQQSVLRLQLRLSMPLPHASNRDEPRIWHAPSI